MHLEWCPLSCPIICHEPGTVVDGVVFASDDGASPAGLVVRSHTRMVPSSLQLAS